jgi:hypothetical protein
MWQDRPHQADPFSHPWRNLEIRTDMSQKWKDYVEDIGMKIVKGSRDQQEWSDENGVCCVLVDNPDRGTPDPTHILVPEELASKIFVLGDLP